MPRYNQPVHLSKQALDVVSRSILNLGLNLAKSLESSASEDKSMAYVDEICRYLRDLFHNKVCRVLANEFTATILKCIHSLYCQNWQWMTEPRCEKMLQGLVEAAVHPDITKLDLDPIVEYIVPKVYKKMSTMTNLTELKLTYLNNEDEGLIVNGVKHLSSLKSFSFNVYCTDRIVQALADSCSQLKCFDVCSSKTVTDLSEPSIVKFRYLEEINVSDTSLTNECLSRLLNVLAEYETKEFSILNAFHGSNISSENLKLLVSKFPNLTQIGLKTFNQSNMSLLKNLKQMKILRLENGSFFLIQDLLDTIGSNLSFLELMDIKDIDVNIVCNTCPNIQNLTIASYEVYSNSPEYEISDKSLYGFKSLKKLTVFEPEDPSFMGYLLSKCINLKEVHMTVGPGFDDAMIKSVLKRNPLNNLEEFSLYSKGSNLTLNTLRNLVEHCPNLAVVRGIQSWKCTGLEEFLQQSTKLYPGVQLYRK
ncbi:hypothetical protein L9F63_021459 [Diploptera punctata]|uniref:Uncharacterized protein n=1 Tax=Diploptera punctata TaxID=6984 RepID=A0AAD7ZNZ6_DIPPU|nr:hypothetical protein L9F63_021459 [Diploptera punctata]